MTKKSDYLEFRIEQAKRALTEIDSIIMKPKETADYITRLWFENYHETIRMALTLLASKEAQK